MGIKTEAIKEPSLTTKEAKLHMPTTKRQELQKEQKDVKQTVPLDTDPVFVYLKDDKGRQVTQCFVSGNLIQEQLIQNDGGIRTKDFGKDGVLIKESVVTLDRKVVTRDFYPDGKLQREINADTDTGKRTTREYGADGKLTKTIFESPDGTVTTKEYNADGKPISSIVTRGEPVPDQDEILKRYVELLKILENKQKPETALSEVIDTAPVKKEIAPSPLKHGEVGRILVNLKTQEVAVYAYNKKTGELELSKQTRVTTGSKHDDGGGPTATGIFTIGKKDKDKHSNSYPLVDGKTPLQQRDEAIQNAIAQGKDPKKIDIKQFGAPMPFAMMLYDKNNTYTGIALHVGVISPHKEKLSHGCVRMKRKDAAALFEKVVAGITQVEIKNEVSFPKTLPAPTITSARGQKTPSTKKDSAP
jgi:YD repeat-containing protein